MSQTRIYHICRAYEWHKAELTGSYLGSSQDIGYIHFSSADQVRKSAAKHRAGQKDLVLITVDPTSLGDDLKWEPSRGGQLFPHLYGKLSFNAVICVDRLPLGPGGVHVFPERLGDG